MTEHSTPPRTRAKAAAVLTISQLAVHAGVTVRTIRHYHQRGLLAEAGRDRSGYRRYDAQAVADLIRIKTLAAAGVPLGRIRELLDSDPADFADAVAAIDQALQQRISDLEALRHELAGLMAGERLVLPAEVADLLDQMRSLDVSERTMTLERDGWTLLMALSPELVPAWAADKTAALADPDFRRCTWPGNRLTTGTPTTPASSSWPPRPLRGWRRNPPARRCHRAMPASRLSTACSPQVATGSPAWRRLDELCRTNLSSGQSSD